MGERALKNIMLSMMARQGDDSVFDLAYTQYSQTKNMSERLGALRALAGQTGCGICGIESLQQIQHTFPPVTHDFFVHWLDQIPDAMVQLQQQQPISAVTGGAHAAAWVVNGNILTVFEDVGRHNALDKLLGHLVKHDIDRSQGFVLMTSRASYELVKKCAQLNISLLATISAPTSLAIELAKRSGLKLASFCRQSRYVVYS